jgi:hypothetical protein
MDVASMADEIRSQGGRDFADPQDVHDTLTGAHQIIEAMQDMFVQMGERLGETGVHPRYAEAVQEAASGMNGIADQLEQVTSGGVMRGPG